MLSMPLRKQGGAAVLTIPPSVLARLDAQVGMHMSMQVHGTKLVLEPVAAAPQKRRYSLAQLLAGVTPSTAKALLSETSWARDGEPVGREIA